jgi:hypothetical protein
MLFREREREAYEVDMKMKELEKALAREKRAKEQWISRYEREKQSDRTKAQKRQRDLVDTKTELKRALLQTRKYEAIAERRGLDIKNMSTPAQLSRTVSMLSSSSLSSAMSSLRSPSISKRVMPLSKPPAFTTPAKKKTPAAAAAAAAAAVAVQASAEKQKPLGRRGKAPNANAKANAKTRRPAKNPAVVSSLGALRLDNTDNSKTTTREFNSRDANEEEQDDNDDNGDSEQSETESEPETDDVASAQKGVASNENKRPPRALRMLESFNRKGAAKRKKTTTQKKMKRVGHSAANVTSDSEDDASKARALRPRAKRACIR